MAKRIYTPKVLSPEMQRENALSAAKAHVYNAKKRFDDCARGVAQWERRGLTEADGITIKGLRRDAARAAEELAICEAELAALTA